ncbi:MAG TPA: TetR/AcrR family transcriptional regulator [Actinomycetales bacterium]
MSAHDRVLDAAAALAAEHRPLPSLDEIARRAGVSKGGLLHHFPDRRAITDALVRRALAETRTELERAAVTGDQVRVWLELSAPREDVLGVAAAVLAAGVGDLPAELAEFSRWVEQLLEQAVGDPVVARVVRLTGDGLFSDSISGTPPSAELVDELVAHFGGRA